jgi:hypothetical protein
MAFVAYYFHWSEEKILEMPHWERKKWCNEISKINKKLGNEPEKSISLEDL